MNEQFPFLETDMPLQFICQLIKQRTIIFPFSNSRHQIYDGFMI